MSVLSHERDEAYLKELMHEFRVPDAPSLNDALHLLQERYRVLWSVFHDPSHWTMLLGADPTGQGNQVPDAASTEVLVRAVHRVLYDGIIRNAGEYRSRLDSNEGAVFFRRPRPFLQI